MSGNLEGRLVYGENGFQMIRTINIRNFRCYRELEINNCARLNVIVGENGSGKTALLEAMFLALATSTDVALRFRQQRGMDGSFGGTARRIEEGLWGDFFYNYDWSRPIHIGLSGDGPEASPDHSARLAWRGRVTWLFRVMKGGRVVMSGS